MVPSKNSTFFAEKGVIPFKFRSSCFPGGALCDVDRKTISFKIRLMWFQVKLRILLVLTNIFCEEKGDHPFKFRGSHFSVGDLCDIYGKTDSF